MEYDLTKQICTFLDAHLMLPLLEFVKGYPEEQIDKVKADILEKTSCYSYAITVNQKIGRDITGLEEKKKVVIEELNKLKSECEVVIQFIEQRKDYSNKKNAATSTSTTTTTTTTTTESKEDAEVVADGDSTTNVQSTPKVELTTFAQLREKVNAKIIDSLYRLAKLSYESGDYGNSRDYLEVFIKLSDDKSKNFSALWGILESDILSLNWVSAVGDIMPIKEEIDSNSSLKPIQQLHQRAWLIHRSLFVYFNHPESRSMLVDLLLDDKYLNAIQTVCPYILRYLAVAIITNRRRPQSLYQLVKVIEQEAYTYRDPITLFVQSLYVKFNFEEAQQYLTQCEKVLAQDFFLVSCLNDFMENARACIFETYCNIHENIDIDMLCNNLGIKPENSEKWIVEAIRNARFVAKIDSANNQIKMFSQHTNAYRQVMDKTKGLFNRGIEILVGINDSRGQQARKNIGQKGGQRLRQSQQSQQTAAANAAAATSAASTTAPKSQENSVSA